jgi:hypothetical protein
MMGRDSCLFAALLVCASLAAPSLAADQRPLILRTPDGGIQPQAVVDSSGVLHLIYLKGDPGAADVFYVRRDPGMEEFTSPIRVNSQPGSAIAIGTIRGAQIALGKNNRVHVAWNGSGKATPKNPIRGVPMLYARLDDSGKAFEEQRNLMQQTYGLDGGGSVAADDKGNVYVAWHGRKGDNMQPGEEYRQVWLARSSDDGKTFATEEVASTEPTGTCGCCGMKAFVDAKGALHMLYRSAQEKENRDMYLLSSSDQGKSFKSQRLHAWKVGVCPMSSEAFAGTEKRVTAAWETNFQIYYSVIAVGGAKAARPQRIAGKGRSQKHPAIAIGPKGDSILVWAEGTGWQKGGALAWQVYDAAGRPTRERGRIADGIPVWSLPTVVADREGRFVIFH